MNRAFGGARFRPWAGFLPRRRLPLWGALCLRASSVLPRERLTWGCFSCGFLASAPTVAGTELCTYCLSERIVNLGKLADEMARPANQEGYVAQRHELMPQYIMVWGQCGCYWLGGTGGDFITPCQTPTCNFQWSEVTKALLELERAEKSLQEANNDRVPELVASNALDTASEAQSQAMMAEGGPVDPAVSAVPETTN